MDRFEKVVQILNEKRGRNSSPRLLDGLASRSSIFLDRCLRSYSDCETFPLGWFHAIRRTRGHRPSTVQPRTNCKGSRSPRDLPPLLGADAISACRGPNEDMVTGTICLVLSKMPRDKARRNNRPRRRNVGLPNAAGRKKQAFRFPIRRTSREREWEQGEKEVAQRGYPLGYLKCVLSDRDSRNRCRH